MLKVLLFALMGCICTVTALPTQTNNTITAVGNWYTVPTLPKEGYKGIGPWPATVDETGKDRVQHVTYCWANEQSAKNLKDILTAAIIIWKPAFEGTALDITLHPNCNGNPDCLCDDLPKPVNAVVISDLGPLPEGRDPDDREGDDEENMDGPVIDHQTRSTVGYDYSNDDDKRHWIKFCGPDAKTTPDQLNLMKREMAHELGHIIGFEHEHQRPDRDNNIDFYPDALIGYEDSVKKLRASTDPAFSGKDDVNDRLEIACDDYKLARKYAPQCLPYVKVKDLDDTPLQSPYTPSGRELPDLASIMIYSSTQAARDKDRFPGGAVMIGYDPFFDGPDEDAPQYQIIQGINLADDNPIFGPSTKDRERVKALYPLRTDG